MSAGGMTTHDLLLRLRAPATFRRLDEAVRRAVPHKKLRYVEHGIRWFGTGNLPASVAGYVSDIRVQFHALQTGRGGK